jgi:predicted RND superfamily exporter protein
VAIGAVFVVLLVTMKSIILPVILVLSIETAIWLNMSIPYFAGNTIFYIAYLIISSIQLGATVDYAILMTDRYRENRATMGRKDAVVATISSTTVSILTSGITLTVVGFLLGKISTHGLLSQLGYFLGKGTLLSMGIVFFVLPGLLYLFDATFTGERKLKLKKSKEPVAE